MIQPTSYLKRFYVRDYLYITFGLMLYAFGLIGFIKPVGTVTGGLVGIGLTLEYATQGAIPVQFTYFIVNFLLCLIAFKILGIKFLTKTIYGIVVLTLLLSLVEKIITQPIINNEPLMSALIGAMLCGAGIGLVFNANGSTGGTDIVVAIVNKYKNMAFGRVMLLCDFIIVVSSYFVLNDWIKVIHGLMVIGVMTYTVDMVINGMRQSVQIFIISEKFTDIANAINAEMNRGCTVLDGMGWYSKKETKVLMVMAKRTESLQIFRLIKAIDENAFISQSVVRGVYGRG
ncbi:MAG: YitT family protein, partial [Prevotellaceae bacterium]|nr:YitT family protein [Prevotellaceae bacterium]